MTASEGSRRGRSPFGFTFIAPLALGATLNPINSTMLSTALVPIAESLHADIAETGWLIDRQLGAAAEAALYESAAAGEIRVATVVCGGNGCVPVQTKAYQKRKQFQAMGHG